MLASLIPAFFLFQLTQDEKGEVVANCDHLRNLTAAPKPCTMTVTMRPPFDQLSKGLHLVLESAMKYITQAASQTRADTLHTELRAPIANSRQRLAGAVNAVLTRLYWSVGQRLRTEVLDGADRAKYGDQLNKRIGMGGLRGG